jgi:hypothetical protein
VVTGSIQERRDEIDRVVAAGLDRARELLLSTSIGPEALEVYMIAEAERMERWRSLALAGLAEAQDAPR